MLKKLFLFIFLLGIPVASFAQTTCLSEGSTFTCPSIEDSTTIVDGNICNASIITDESGNKIIYCPDPCAEDPNFDLIGKNDKNCVNSQKKGCTDGKASYQCVNGAVQCVKDDPICPPCIDSANFEDIGTPCISAFNENDPDGTKCIYEEGTWKCIDNEAVCDAPAPICSSCVGEEDYDKIGTVCSVSNEECQQENTGTYECVRGEIICNAEKPNCLQSCDDIDVSLSGTLTKKQQDETNELLFKTAKGYEGGVQIGYTCVRTGASYSNTGIKNVGMFGWHTSLYDNNYESMITAAIKGEEMPTYWDDDRQFFFDNRKDAKEAYNNNQACYVCASIRINGCFAPDAEIKLANGSIKQAKDVKAGDELFNPLTKKGVIVDKVVEGPEDVGMVNIKTANSALKVSQEHPILTAKGLLQAKDLKAGDIIFNSDNQEIEVASVEILPVEEGQYVINFIVKGDDVKDYKNRMLLSNGIISGDLTTQIELKLKK